jgi:hypothetical protein
MNLTASVILRNELGRYLGAFLDHLLEFTDQIVIFDDDSDDGWEEALRPGWGRAERRISIIRRNRGGAEAFRTHAAARNQLLQETLAIRPDHIVAIDADEFVSDGALLRRMCQQHPGRNLSLELCEVWEACDERLCVRTDGQWRPRGVAMCWAPGRYRPEELRIVDRKTATGRTPELTRRGEPPVWSGAACFHFGWAREEERAERASRYAPGSGHADAHVRSIMWPPERVSLEGWAWPRGLPREALLPKVTA